MSHSNGISFIGAYQLLSTSKNYLNNWFTGNIYLFISLLTAGIVGLLYHRDMKRTGEMKQTEKVLIKLGDNSYILYLLHWPILVALKRLVHHWGALFVVTLIVSIAMTMIFNWLCVSVRKKLSGGK